MILSILLNIILETFLAHIPPQSYKAYINSYVHNEMELDII